MSAVSLVSRRLGREPATSRQVYLLSLTNLADFPARLDLPCPRFVLLLAADFDVSTAERNDLAERALQAGCVYFCAWGNNCEIMHDIFDETVLAHDLCRESEGTIMTTWHSDEPLADAAHFALMSAEPDGIYSAGCDAVVLAAVGNSKWLSELESTAAQYVR
jgi:hypothetical protein